MAADRPAAAAPVVTPVVPPVTPPRVTPPPAAVPSGRSSAPVSPPAAARPKADWAAEVADRIDEVVAKVRANTSDRLVGIARMVVYGLLAAVLGLVAVVLALILAGRVLAAIPGEVWIPYLVLGRNIGGPRAVAVVEAHRQAPTLSPTDRRPVQSKESPSSERRP